MHNITLVTGVPLVVDKVHVTSFVTSVARGPVELSTVIGAYPNQPGEIGLGATTMHQVGAHIGSIVPVVIRNPSGGSRPVRMRVVATVAFPTGVAASQAGLGTGAAMSMSAFWTRVRARTAAGRA